MLQLQISRRDQEGLHVDQTFKLQFSRRMGVSGWTKPQIGTELQAKKQWKRDEKRREPPPVEPMTARYNRAEELQQQLPAPAHCLPLVPARKSEEAEAEVGDEWVDEEEQQKQGQQDKKKQRKEEKKKRWKK